MNWLKPISLCLLAVVLFFLLNSRHGEIPPPGKFFNPFAGFWQNNTSLDKLPSTLELHGLRDTVRIIWDDRRVPHIFANNLHDVMFAQGYCVARDRLWQMDFQARAAMGRLSEVAGSRTLKLDQFARHIGLNVITERTAHSILADSTSGEYALAYCEGVNAWIAALDEARLPLEFKILDYRPEEWTISKIAAGFSNFCLTLSFGANDSAMTHARSILGDSLMSILYPDKLPFLNPVVPAGTRWDFSPLPVRNPVDSSRTGRPPAETPSPPRSAIPSEELISRGSNNWAVSGWRAAGGHPLLCNDPHLGLTLPSIWYEVQLASPEMNVYGVSTPGAPGVLIGFNTSIAWGQTNAGTDVMDWYTITFKDSSCNEYLYDGKWLPTHKRVETMRVRGGVDVVDTVVYTHHGPVVTRAGEQYLDSRVPAGCAMRWTALDPSNSVTAFFRVNLAQEYSRYLDALSIFDGPAQNFAYADIQGNIAIWHNGKFPLRWKNQGRFLSDGSDPLYDWQGWIPHQQLPHVFNPSRGFVSSANQPPTDGTYPYYLPGGYVSFERATRINERLAAIEKATPATMMELQNDVFNLRAAKVLPHLLSLIDERELTPEESRCYQELENWGYEQRADLIGPQIFEYWWRALHLAIWVDRMTYGGKTLPLPRSDVTLSLMLTDKAGRFADNPRTAEVETLVSLARRTYVKAISQMRDELGQVVSQWSLGSSRGTSLLHLAQIPGLGRMNLKTGGNYATVNAIQKRFGPSWRMVVELDSPPKGWGVYPGGQSGNPGSAFYDNFVDMWVAGKYYELVFLQTPAEKNTRLSGTTLMRSAK